MQPEGRSSGQGAGLDTHRVALVLTLGLAAALRLWGLGREGLWTDECTTAVYASLPVRAMLAQVGGDCQAPLFYLLEKGVTTLLGNGEWQLRLVSAACGWATVALLYLAGRRFVSARAGLFAAFLLAVNPCHVHYSREARNYSLLALLTLVAVLAAWALSRAPSMRRAVFLALAFLAMAYTHALGLVYASCLALPHLIAILLPRSAGISGSSGPRWRLACWMVAGGLVVAGYLPWLPTVAGQTGGSAAIYHWARQAWDDAFPWQVLQSLAVLGPGAPPPTRNLATDFPLAAWAAMLAAVGFAAFGVAHRREWRARDAAWPLVVSTLLPLVVLFVISWATAPVHVVGRVEVALTPAAMLLVASGLRPLARRFRFVPVVAASLFALMPLRSELAGTTRSAERAMVTALARATRPGDVVIVTGVMTHAFQYYLDRMRPDVTLTTFPPELARHPGWMDWSRMDDSRLRLESADLVRSLGTSEPRHAVRHAWLFLERSKAGEPHLAVLVDALDHGTSLVRVDPHFGPWGHELREYLLPSATSR